jgi:hypothetical protein
MVKLIEELPQNVVGFTAHGHVTREDYDTVLIPAVEAKLKEQAKIGCLYVLAADFEGFKAGAMLEDAKVGLAHLTAWSRIAFVTDVAWMRDATKAMGFLMPCPVKVFALAELEQAKAWIAE